MAARLPYLDREQVPPDVQAVYDKMKKATGRVLNTFRLMAHHARSVAPVVAFYGTLREGASRPLTSPTVSTRRSARNWRLRAEEIPCPG